MSRELFGDITRPSVSVASRKWYTLPVSLVSHSLIVAVLIALPILAPAVLPSIAPDIDPYFMPVAPNPPLAPRPLQPTPVRPVVNPNAAPLEAPNAITKETGLEAGFENSVGIVDAGVGLVAGPITTGVGEAPAPPRPQAPVRVGGAIRQPVRVRDVSPVYPQIAQAARVQGLVIIEATIGTDGQVVNGRVLRSVPLLDQAALDAVRQWQYTPTLLNGVPVPVVMTVTVSFTLR